MLNSKSIKTNRLRYNEYYNIQNTLDELYIKSLKGKEFTKLTKIIFSDENILLAYRNIKNNKGSSTSGVTKETIDDIKNIDTDTIILTIKNKVKDYKPKAVRRVEIPKPNGKTRPLGIPDIWDRLIQQCVLQVLEPICEAKFHERSNGFRPNRSAENAIAQCAKMINMQKMYYVVDVDIKGFFDNVNHSKLIKQIWQLGIRDKTLICIIKAMLKAPILMPNGETVYPTKGTPQGGILSPLLSNICLNEFDWWISSQWEDFKTDTDYKLRTHKTGTVDKGNKYKMLRKSNLKEMYIIRYADDFKIFCKEKNVADKAYFAVKDWLGKRLKLEVSDEKSKVINLKKQYSEFLGFKIKAIRKGKKRVMISHISDKNMKRIKDILTNSIKFIQHGENAKSIFTRVNSYNYKIWGIHNYYGIATHVSYDLRLIAFHINRDMHNRLGSNLKKTGNLKDSFIKRKYGRSKQLRYINEQPICPIGYIKTRNPMFKKAEINRYTIEGREAIHRDVGLDFKILLKLMKSEVINRSVEYTDNRISLFSAQKGKCAISNIQLTVEDIHCHHKLPKSMNGTDRYENLIIVHKYIHRLIHAKEEEIIQKYINMFDLKPKMLNKLNNLREMCNLDKIVPMNI